MAVNEDLMSFLAWATSAALPVITKLTLWSFCVAISIWVLRAHHAVPLVSSATGAHVQLMSGTWRTYDPTYQAFNT